MLPQGDQTETPVPPGTGANPAPGRLRWAPADAWDALRLLWWRAALHRGLVPWLAFLGFVTVGFRLLVLPEVTWLGLLDDLTLAALVGALLAAGTGWPRWLRLGVLGPLGLALVTFNFINAEFYAFFHSFVNQDSWRLLTQAQGARTSLRAVFTRDALLWHAVVPATLLAVALARSRHARPRLPAPGAGLMLPAALAAAALQGVLALTPPLATENNGVLVLGRQWAHRAWLQRRTGKAAREEARAALMALLPAPPAAEWRRGHDLEHPLLREPLQPAPQPARRLNVIVMLMESVRLMELGIGAPGEKLAPNLDRLAHEGLFFPHFYANHHQTVRGEFTTLCGTLDNVGGGQMYSMFTDIAMPCLPSILADAGYQTYWISSFPAAYAGKKAFLSRHGIQEFRDNTQLDKRPLQFPRVGWGASDEDLVDFALDELDHATAPFFAEVMTLSNHHPFPATHQGNRLASVEATLEDRFYKNYLAGMRYTDVAVGRLVERARTRAWFKDTVFVFLGDHGVWLFPEQGRRRLTPAEQLEVYHRVPLIIWSPGNVPPGQRPVLGSQVDVAPTVLDLLGIRAPNAFQGVSLLADPPPDQPLVITGTETGWSIRQGDAYCYRVGAECYAGMHPVCPPGYKARRAAHSCFRAAGDLLQGDGPPLQLELMSERDATRLLQAGQSALDAYAGLLLHDNVFPTHHAP